MLFSSKEYHNEEVFDIVFQLFQVAVNLSVQHIGCSGAVHKKPLPMYRNKNEEGNACLHRSNYFILKTRQNLSTGPHQDWLGYSRSGRSPKEVSCPKEARSQQGDRNEIESDLKEEMVPSNWQDKIAFFHLCMSMICD